MWNWDTKAHGKDDTHFRVRTIFDGKDTYRMHLLRRAEDTGEYVLLMDIGLRRVDRAPERFMRLRHRKTKGSGSRVACLTMVFKLMESASRKWRALNGSTLIADVIAGVEFADGVKKIAA